MLENRFRLDWLYSFFKGSVWECNAEFHSFTDYKPGNFTSLTTYHCTTPTKLKIVLKKFQSGQSFNFEGVPSDFVSLIPSFFCAQAWTACYYQHHDCDILVQLLFFHSHPSEPQALCITQINFYLLGYGTSSC